MIGYLRSGRLLRLWRTTPVLPLIGLMVAATVAAWAAGRFLLSPSIATWLYLPLVLFLTIRWGRGYGIIAALLADLLVLLIAVEPLGIPVSRNSADYARLAISTIGTLAIAWFVSHLYDGRVVLERDLAALAAHDHAEVSRLQLAAIVESSEDAITSSTLDGLITSWNAGAEQLYGYTGAEVIGQSISLLVPPDRANELAKILESLQRGARIDPYETERLTKDDRRVRVWLTASPIKNASGQIIAVSAITRDITERTRAQTALAESEARFRGIVETATEGIWLVDAEVHTLLANERMASLLGTSVEGLLGRTVIEFCFPEDLELAQEHIGRNLRGLGEQFDFRFRRRDGTAISVLACTSPLPDAAGRVIGALGMFSDITARKQLEEERANLLLQVQAAHETAEVARRRLEILTRTSQQFLAAGIGFDEVLETIAQCVTEALGAGCIVRLASEDSQRFLLSAAYHSDPKICVALRELARQSSPGGHQISSAVFRTGQPVLMSVVDQDQIKGTFNPEYWPYLEQADVQSMLVVPLRGQTRVLGTLASLRGASDDRFTADDRLLLQELADRAVLAIENASLYRDAMEAIHVRDEFLSSISHDLRTPLTTARGMVQLAARQMARSETPADTRLIALLTDADRATQAMGRMIDELLDLSRLQAGRPLDLNRQRTNLVALARQLVAEHQWGTDRHEISLEASVPELRGFWDPARLERVLANLLSNAVKFSPDGGVIRVMLRLLPEHGSGPPVVELSVRDSGIGIPAGDLPRVFERFHRGSNVVARIAGAGIGLATARQIVEQHGGTLHVESAEGVGTTVIMRLPTTDARAGES